MAKRLILLSAISLFSLLFGCINYEQTLNLNEDGSGVAEIHYWYQPDSYPPEATNPPPPSTETEVKNTYEKGGMKVYDLKIFDQVEDVSPEGVESEGYGEIADGDREKKYDLTPDEREKIEQEMESGDGAWKHVRFSLSFDDINSLPLAGLVDLADVESCTWQETDEGYTFTEKVSPNKDYGSDEMENFNVSFTVSMPGAVVSASEPGVISGNQVTWKWNLKKFSTVGYNFTMTCTCEKPISEEKEGGGIGEFFADGLGLWLWVAIGGVIAVIVVVIIIIFVLRRKKKRGKIPQDG